MVGCAQHGDAGDLEDPDLDLPQEVGADEDVDDAELDLPTNDTEVSTAPQLEDKVADVKPPAEESASGKQDEAEPTSKFEESEGERGEKSKQGPSPPKRREAEDDDDEEEDKDGDDGRLKARDEEGEGVEEDKSSAIDRALVEAPPTSASLSCLQ